MHVRTFRECKDPVSDLSRLRHSITLYDNSHHCLGMIIASIHVDSLNTTTNNASMHIQVNPSNAGVNFISIMLWMAVTRTGSIICTSAFCHENVCVRGRHGRPVSHHLSKWQHHSCGMQRSKDPGGSSV